MFGGTERKFLSDTLKENFDRNKELLSWVLFYYSATICKESNTPGNRFDKPFIYEKILRKGIEQFGWHLPKKRKTTHSADDVYNFVEKDKKPYDYVFFNDIRVSQKNWPSVDGTSIIISNEQKLKVTDLTVETYYDVLWVPAYKDATNYLYSFDESKECMLDCNGKIICKLRPNYGKRIFSQKMYRAKYNQPMNDHYSTLQEKFFQEILDNISIEKL